MNSHDFINARDGSDVTFLDGQISINIKPYFPGGIMFRLLQFFFLMLFTINCYAFHCTVLSTGQTIQPYGGSADVTVTVSTNITNARTLVFDMNGIRCDMDGYGVQDDLYLTAIETTLNPNENMSTADITPLGSGTVTKNIPLSGNYKMLHLQHSTPTAYIPVKLYLKVVDNPSSPIFVVKGQTIYRITFNQTNSEGESNSYVWNLIAGNSVHLITTTCTINNGETLAVDFGNVLSTDISNSKSGTPTITKTFPISCKDKSSESMGIAVYGTSVSGFDEPDAYASSSPDLGVVVSHDGITIGNQKKYDETLLNGVGSSSLDFSLVKKNDATVLAGGAFSASAVLVVMTP